LREENVSKNNFTGTIYSVCPYREWLERNKIADGHLQIELYIEVILGGLNTGMPQQFADLRYRHTSASTKFGIGSSKIMRLQLGFTDHRTALLNDVI